MIPLLVGKRKSRIMVTVPLCQNNSTFSPTINYSLARRESQCVLTCIWEREREREQSAIIWRCRLYVGKFTEAIKRNPQDMGNYIRTWTSVTFFLMVYSSSRDVRERERMRIKESYQTPKNKNKKWSRKIGMQSHSRSDNKVVLSSHHLPFVIASYVPP